MRFFRPLTMSLALTVCSCSSPPDVPAVKSVVTAVESTVSSVNAGTVKAEHMAELAFGAVGRVTKLDVKFGDHVRKGQVLANLANDDLLSTLQTAEKTFNRRKSLMESKALAVQDFEEANRLFEIAKVAYENTVIRAPFDGIITEQNIEIGQLSQITAVVPRPLLRIVDTEPRYIMAEIDEADLGKVTLGLEARIKILAVRQEPFHATIRKVIPYVSTVREQDRTVQVELTIDSDGIMLPVGASADVEIVVKRVEHVLAVPTRALLGRSSDRYVYGYVNGRVTKLPIKIGVYNYERSQVVSGLEKDAAVLLSSESVELKEGSKVHLSLVPWP